MPGEAGQGGVPNCSAKCDAIETRNATPQAPASAGEELQKKTEPAATIEVAAGSARITPVVKTGQVAGTGSQQTRFRSGKQGGESVCDAKCDAISQGRVELLARAVLLVAGMEISEPDRAAVLARVVADAGRNPRS